MEAATRIEPCLFDDTTPTVLSDLAVDIQREANELGKWLPAKTLTELADLVRLMNCYYTNLIEGHIARPLDIERALSDEQIIDENRPLALEAKAHVEVQRQIDHMAYRGRLPCPTEAKFLQWIHTAFYDNVPNEYRYLERSDGTIARIVPGKFRNSKIEDVDVGHHLPPAPEDVERFVSHFAWRYRHIGGNASQAIIAMPCAHHRLLHVHPFVDGNGRVARLMSHAMAHQAGIAGNGLWSNSRGLARGLQDRNEYKAYLNRADTQRQGGRDGRGNLSLKALEEFAEWYLLVVRDQIRFSKAVFDFDNLKERYTKLISDVTGDRYAISLVEAVFRFGELRRGDAPLALKTSERTARNTLSMLTRSGFLKSDTPKGPVRIAFPIDYRERFFPNLFADAAFEPPEPDTPSGQP